MTTPLFSTTVTAHGGRTGRVTSPDGRFDHALAMPKEIGGPGGEGTNPEQLFAAGYAACFEGALRLMARVQKVALKDVKITAKVALYKTETGGFKLGVDLVGAFTELPADAAKGLMEAAHGVCPYSMATRGNIDVTLSVA